MSRRTANRSRGTPWETQQPTATASPEPVDSPPRWAGRRVPRPVPSASAQKLITDGGGADGRTAGAASDPSATGTRTGHARNYPCEGPPRHREAKEFCQGCDWERPAHLFRSNADWSMERAGTRQAQRPAEQSQRRTLNPVPQGTPTHRTGWFRFAGDVVCDGRTTVASGMSSVTKKLRRPEPAKLSSWEKP